MTGLSAGFHVLPRALDYSFIRFACANVGWLLFSLYGRLATSLGIVSGITPKFYRYQTTLFTYIPVRDRREFQIDLSHIYVYNSFQRLAVVGTLSRRFRLFRCRTKHCQVLGLFIVLRKASRRRLAPRASKFSVENYACFSRNNK
jgi:hypothetical protein